MDLGVPEVCPNLCEEDFYLIGCPAQGMRIYRSTQPCQAVRCGLVRPESS
jgi:hypothetical protein